MRRLVLLFMLLALILPMPAGAVVWTTPTTPTTGDPVGPTFWDPQVRDNLQYLYDNLGATAGFFRGCVVRTHVDSDKAAAQVLLVKCDQVVTHDGIGTANWSNLTASTSSTGAGALDTGTEQASTWYEIYAIRKSSDGTKNLLLHRAKDFLLDETYDSDDATVEIRKSTGTRTAVAQGFKVDTTGLLEFVDVELIKVGSPTGNITVTIQSDAAGVPSGSTLDTCDTYNVANIATAAQWVRFVCRSPATLTATTQYHLVISGDWTLSDAAYIGWRADTSSASYANGTRTQLEAAVWNNTGTTTHDFSFKAYITRNDTAVTMPSGYDGRCLIGYTYNDSGSNLDAFYAVDRHVIPLENSSLLGSASLAPPDSTHGWLFDIPSHVPPVPLRAGFYMDIVTTGGAGGTGRVGPVPDGIVLSTVRVGGEARLTGGLNTGGTDAGEAGYVPTETQAVYVTETPANAIDNIGLSWYEW